MTDKFSHKLPKEELKRLGKDVAKILVASDFKNDRVQDPAAPLTKKKEQHIKKYVKGFLDRAVEKYEGHQKKRAPEVAKESTGDDAPNDKSESVMKPDAAADEAEDLILSDADSPDGADRKRKRDDEMVDPTVNTPADGPDMKRLKENGVSGASPPPPPPPPPQSALEWDVEVALKSLIARAETPSSCSAVSLTSKDTPRSECITHKTVFALQVMSAIRIVYAER